MNLLNGPDFGRLRGAINAAESRQKVIADNIANVDTPHFKRSEVVFEDLLERQMNSLSLRSLDGIRTHEKHLQIGQGGSEIRPRLVTDEFSVMNNNINNVDIDSEMSLLAKNQLRYNALIQQLSHDVRMMRTAIEGRGV